MCKQPLLHNFFDSLSRRVFISHVQAVNLETFFATIRISGCAAATIWDNSSSFSWRDLLEIKDQCFISTYAVNIQIHRNGSSTPYWNLISKKSRWVGPTTKTAAVTADSKISSREQEHSPQVIIIMATIIIIKIICAFWMCIVVCSLLKRKLKH